MVFINKSATCREIGAMQTFNKKLNEVSALKKYRSTYQKLYMQYSREKDNLELRSKFDSWKVKAKKLKKEFSDKQITEK